MKSIICAIHQPNFFPWLGYFDKIRRVDAFVFLDDVDYPKSGSGMGSWTNRVKLNIQGRATWVGCPIKRQPGSFAIRAAQIDDSQPWRTKMLRTIEMNYKKAPNYANTMDILELLIKYPTDNLTEFNINAIQYIAQLLGLSCNYRRQSALGIVGQGTELLIAITKACNADTYLCGGGAIGYQEDSLFAPNKLNLIYQNFIAKAYGPLSRYLPGLSIIDFLMYGILPGQQPNFTSVKEATL